MNRFSRLTFGLVIGLGGAAVGAAADAENFNIPSGDLSAALDSYTRQTGISLIISGEDVRSAHTRGVRGELSAETALSRILNGTGFDVRRRPSGALVIVPGPSSSSSVDDPISIAQATPAPRGTVETVTVTSSKLGGADVQIHPHLDHGAFAGAIDGHANCGRP